MLSESYISRESRVLFLLIVCSFMMCVNNRLHYGLAVVLCPVNLFELLCHSRYTCEYVVNKICIFMIKSTMLKIVIRINVAPLNQR